MTDLAPVKVGVIGVGGIAQYLHIKQYTECEGVQVTALCDPRQEAMAATQRRWGLERVTCAPTVEAMLAQADLDAVSICTPNNSHRDLALAAIDAGVAVLCEKPLAMNAVEAREMADAAQAAGVVNMTGFSKRFFPAARLARSLIEEGELGEIVALEGHYVQGAWLDPEMPLVWRFRRDRAGSGALGDLGSHLYDLARWWAGEGAEVAALERTLITERPLLEGKGVGTVDVDDHAAFVVQFENGAVGTFTASRLAGGVHDDCRLTAHGSRGTVTFTTQEPMKLRACLGRRLMRLYTFTEVQVPREYAGVEEIPTFVQAVRSGTPVEPSFVDGLRCQELLDGVLESARTGRRVSLPQPSP